MLRTDAQTLSDGTQLRPDVFAQDVGRPRGGREETCQDGPAVGTGGQKGPGSESDTWMRTGTGMVLYSHGGGFSGSVVSEEGRDLSLVEAERQSIYCQLLPVTINLHQVLDVDA